MAVGGVCHGQWLAIRSARVMWPPSASRFIRLSHSFFQWKTVTASVTLFTNKKEGLGGDKCVTVTEAFCGNHRNWSYSGGSRDFLLYFQALVLELQLNCWLIPLEASFISSHYLGSASQTGKFFVPALIYRARMDLKKKKHHEREKKSS